MQDILFTVSETAKILKCNTPFVYELIKSGLIQPLKLGRYKIRKTTLEKFLETFEGYDVTDPNNVKRLDSAKVETEEEH